MIGMKKGSLQSFLSDTGSGHAGDKVGKIAEEYLQKIPLES